jgi:hypothetical protein
VHVCECLGLVSGEKNGFLQTITITRDLVKAYSECNRKKDVDMMSLFLSKFGKFKSLTLSPYSVVILGVQEVRCLP